MAGEAATVLTVVASGAIALLGSGLIFLGFLEGAITDATRLSVLSDARRLALEEVLRIRRLVTAVMVLCAVSATGSCAGILVQIEWIAWPALALLATQLALIVLIARGTLQAAAKRVHLDLKSHR